ncbi:MAG: hypothetical protein U1F16_04735 [Turneriella sp.]
MKWEFVLPSPTPIRVTILAFLVILFGHALWIFIFGCDVPFRDQWSSELHWYRLLVTDAANWDALIAPHNEHRIAVTRLFNGLIFRLLGGWHPIAAMYAQTFVIASAVAILVYLLWKYAGRWRKIAVIFTLVVFLSPYAWQNILNGFQNQFYFMLLFALVALFLVSFHTSWSGILMAIVLAAVSHLTMAGGILTSMSLVFGLVLVFITKRTSFFKFAVAMMLMIAVILWQIRFLHHVPGHDALKAHTVAEFVVAIVKVLSWAEIPIGILLWGVGFYVVLQNYLHRPGSFISWLANLTGAQIFVLCMCGWLLLQLAATAYSRAHSGLTASRYQQTYSLIIPLFFLLLNLFETKLKWLRTWVVAVMLLTVIGIRNGKEWLPLRREAKAMRSARVEIATAVKMNNFGYLKSKDDGEFSLGYPAEGIWQNVHDQTFLPYHLWLE